MEVIFILIVLAFLFHVSIQLYLLQSSDCLLVRLFKHIVLGINLWITTKEYKVWSRIEYCYSTYIKPGKIRVVYNVFEGNEGIKKYR